MPDQVVPFLPSALERDVKQALADASLHDVYSYGWLNENDPDPDFIGHAMWQIDQPRADLDALMGQPVRRRPYDSEREIISAGEDFCGLMQASRLSIGLALLWYRQARGDPFGNSPFFWLHHTDALLKLAIASDRLRDLLVVACTGATPKSYMNQCKRHRLYVTPFRDAEMLLVKRGLNDPRLSEPLASLPSLAEAVWGFIERRNKIVHEVATRMAKFMRDSVSKLQQRYDDEQEHGLSLRPENPAGSLSAADARLDGLRSDFDCAKDELGAWYTLLIETSNYVFQVEYWSRDLGPK